MMWDEYRRHDDDCSLDNLCSTCEYDVNSRLAEEAEGASQGIPGTPEVLGGLLNVFSSRKPLHKMPSPSSPRSGADAIVPSSREGSSA